MQPTVDASLRSSAPTDRRDRLPPPPAAELPQRHAADSFSAVTAVRADTSPIRATLRARCCDRCVEVHVLVPDLCAAHGVPG